jgi:phosphoglycerate dehydrogenase-like enzyme
MPPLSDSLELVSGAGHARATREAKHGSPPLVDHLFRPADGDLDRLRSLRIRSARSAWRAKMANGVIKVGVARSALLENGRSFFDPAALGILDAAPGVAWEYLPDAPKRLTADHCAAYDVICAVSEGIGAEALGRGDLRLRLLAGFGAGYDTRDVKALTDAGVLLTNNPNAVRRPMATTQLTFVLALAHKLLIKDRMTREGRWSEQRSHYGTGLIGRTLGSLGIGNIGRELFRIAKPLDMRFIAHDPYVKQEDVADLGVTLVDFDTLFRESDFLVTNVLLNAATRGIVGARALGLMKPSAYLISAARGPVVDEAALYRALVEKRIAGAGMDVFEIEPTPPDNPILKLDTVIVSPHSLCHTDECNRSLAEGSFRSAAAFARRARPAHLINPEALAHPRQAGWIA